MRGRPDLPARLEERVRVFQDGAPEGEFVHHNVRMTWGKAFLSWAELPESALELALDLNDRHALDGRDPTSYGGILWCFGPFDRLFTPEVPVLGTVGPRASGPERRPSPAGSIGPLAAGGMP